MSDESIKSLKMLLSLLITTAAMIGPTLAQELPHYDVINNCYVAYHGKKLQTDFNGMPMEQTCPEHEQHWYDMVKDKWPKYPAAAKQFCVEHNRPANPDAYFKLYVCIDEEIGRAKPPEPAFKY